MNEQNPRQLQGVADLLATRGRYGDSMMVHMNPIEVEGLASMSPTGSLTINPDTGQPEAFLPFLLPLLGGLGGSALAGSAALSTTALAGKAALLGAVGSGLGSFAATGDIKQGLISGITGFGIGSALSGLGGAASGAAAEGTKAGAIELAKSAGHTASDQAIKSAITDGLAMSPNLGQIGSDASKLAYDASIQAGRTAASEAVINPLSKAGLKALTSTPTLLAAGVGEGTNMQIRADNMLDQQNKDALRQNEQDYEGAKSRLEANVYSEDIKPYDDYANYAGGGGITSVDPSDFQRRFNDLVEMGVPIKGMNYGGMTFPSGAFFAGMNTGENAPASRQASLRDIQSITPEQLQQTYQNQGLPGFGPEIMYFTPEKGKDPNPFKGWTPDPVAVEETGTQAEITKAKMKNWYAGISPHPGRPPESEADKAFYSLLKSLEGTSGNDRTNLINQYNKGLESVATETVTTPATIAAAAAAAAASTGAGTGASNTAATGNLTADDYMKLYGQYMNYGNINVGMAEGGEIQDLSGGIGSLGMAGQENQEADRLIELASMAVLGDLPEEESGVVIQAFIDEFGNEAFQMLREQVLEGIVPGSQKEGEIVGSGGGMDDEVMGMIGNQQPVAVSPGEYIVPADVVSGLGDGSTDAGVQELDGMLDRVRVERTNTTQQPAPLRKGGVLPR